MAQYIDNKQYGTGSLTPGSGSGGGGDITVDDQLSTTSTNPVQNKVITNELNKKVDSTSLSGYVQDTREINGKPLSADITLTASDVSAVPNTNFTSGGTVVEGLFSELPQFIADLSGKMSNGTITYKITQDETIDMSVLPDFYGSVGIAVPQWNIPEVVIDGNNKSITINSSNPYVPCVAFVPADYNMNTGKLMTNLNSKYQVIKIKDITLTGTPQNGQATLFNSADINLKVENSTIINTIEGSVITVQDGLNEIYDCTITSQGATVTNNVGISAINMGSVKCYNNIYNNIGTEVYTKAGGRVQANNELYDGITFEGKFSDLPTFFASLDGKNLNGTVTYKITQDETLSTTTTIDTRAYLVPVFMPRFSGKIIIDGNEKTITSSVGSSVLFGVLPYSADNGSTFDIDANIEQTLVIRNLNITNQNSGGSGLRNEANINLLVENSTITTTNHNFISIRGNVKIRGCEITATTNGWGVGIMKTCKGLSELNIYKNCSSGLVAGFGGLVQSIDDTYSNCTNTNMTSHGGFIILNSASTKKISSEFTNQQYYTIYNT